MLNLIAIVGLLEKGVLLDKYFDARGCIVELN
jgi:hypothetical protein